MKKIALYLVCALALASCGSKANQQVDAQADAAMEAACINADADVVNGYAPDGTVHELDNAGLYAPGVRVPNLTVLDFNAPWCGPCRQLTPVVHELAGVYEGRVTFVTVNIDNYGELFEAYNLGNSIPAVLFIKPDGTTESYVGTGELLPSENFAAIVDRNLE